MKKYVFLFLLMSTYGFSQAISGYKYVIVPSKFDAQKKPGQFGLNNLTKLFLEKNGYTVFYDSDILPPEVSGESCNKIYANVFENNSLRTTKLRVEVKDCRNAVLFVSAYGESMEKDNHIAYNQALRSAFKSFDKPQFRHNPDATNSVKVDTVSPANNPETKNTGQLDSTVTAAQSSSANVLNAQKIANGYQLIDTTPKIVLKMFVTSQPDIFTGVADGKNGLVLKKNGQWFFEYYKDSQLISEPLNIKF